MKPSRLISAICFRLHRWPILQPRMAIAWQFEPKSVFRTGFWDFQRYLAGHGGGPDRTNPLTTRRFREAVLGSVGGTAIAPGVPNSAVDATMTANQIFTSGFSSGTTFVRISPVESRKLSSTGRDHGRPGRKTPRALLHGVEPGNGTSIWNDG